MKHRQHQFLVHLPPSSFIIIAANLCLNLYPCVINYYLILLSIFLHLTKPIFCRKRLCFIVPCVSLFLVFRRIGEYISLDLFYKYNQTKPNQTKPNRTKPNRTEPNRTKPNQTEPNQTKPKLRSSERHFSCSVALRRFSSVCKKPA